jgi:hypothetical protein
MPESFPIFSASFHRKSEIENKVEKKEKKYPDANK